MAETKKIVDGNLEITKTSDVVVTTMTEEEVVGKIAEVQTKIDHLNVNVNVAEAEKSRWEAHLVEIQK